MLVDRGESCRGCRSCAASPPSPSASTPFFVARGSSRESNVLRKHFFYFSDEWLKNAAIFLLI